MFDDVKTVMIFFLMFLPLSAVCLLQVELKVWFMVVVVVGEGGGRGGDICSPHKENKPQLELS